VDGDIFYGCWDKEGYEWEFYSFSAIILDNKLNKRKFKFGGNNYPEDANLNVKEGRCFDFDFIEPGIKEKHRNIVSMEIN